MRKIYTKIILVMVAVTALFSCSKDKKDVFIDHSMETLLDKSIEDAKYHSKGLDYIYQNLNELDLSEFRSVSQDLMKTCEDFIDKKSLEYSKKAGRQNYNLVQKTNKITLNNVRNNFEDKAIREDLRSLNVNPHSVDLQEQLFKLIDDIASKSNADLTESELKKIIIERLVEVEDKDNIQAYIITASIYFDSYVYWKQNYSHWSDKLNNSCSENLRGLRIGFWRRWKNEVMAIVETDARSAAAATVLGTTVASVSAGTLVLPAAGAVATASVAGSGYDYVRRHFL